jgi:hypothetical protein
MMFDDFFKNRDYTWWSWINSDWHVIDETTSQSTKPASWQVAGYPSQAGMTA